MPTVNQDRVTRRAFFRSSAAAGAALAASAVSRERDAFAAENAELEPGTVILFQGDSITDAGRNRQSNGPNNWSGLGRGYPYLLGGALLADHPQAQLKVYNRGISGNKVPDLNQRWQEDTMALKPNARTAMVATKTPAIDKKAPCARKKTLPSLRTSMSKPAFL